MRRRPLLMVLAVALPTLLLGAGWLYASLREQAALQREQRRILMRTADAVRGAVDESLEELRHREDQRPFYLYNPLYSPPDVLSVVDPVARSPLARDPDDPRILGYFQLEPDGNVRTPYSFNEPDRNTSPRGALVTERASSPEFGILRSLSIDGNAAIDPLAAAEPSNGSPSQEIDDWVNEGSSFSSSRRPSGWGSPPRRPRRQPRLRPESVVERPAGDGGPAESVSPTPMEAAVIAQAPPANAELRPQGPLTTNLNFWGQDVYNDIQQAQQGDLEANRRIVERGRAAPITRRNTVSWDEVEQAQNAVREGQERRRNDVQNKNQNQPQAKRGGGNRRRPRVEPPEPEPPAETAEPTKNESSPQWPMQQTEAEVDYTPMAWRRVGQELVLHRVVSHEEAYVVQGVLLNREHMVKQWIPSVIRRHAVAGIEPWVVEDEANEECAVHRPVSEVLDDVLLCYPEEALAMATAGRLDAVGGVLVPLELAALAGLVLIVTLAGVAMYRATRHAEELSAQKSAFVSAVSHELRTPLTTIRMHAEMLRDGLVSKAKRPKFHDQLVHESVRLSHLVDNVLELSRLEEGRRELRPNEADLGAAVGGIVEQQRPFIEVKGVELELVESDGPITVSFDRQAIAQIVVNLMDNAVKYGGGEAACVEVGVTAVGDGALITVRDNGPGVPETEREKVFERFHRVEAPGCAHMPGTGIGLCLVRELARAHGGEAEVGEAPDGGCEVRVVIPGAGPRESSL